MIKKFKFGKPFETEAVTFHVDDCSLPCPYGNISVDNGFQFTYTLGNQDVIYGLGESVRGINKRGFHYINIATDQGNHAEDKHSLYGAHNFIIVSGLNTFGLFIDYPSAVTFDLGFTKQDTLSISCDNSDLYLYIIEGLTPYEITKQFRQIIGRSYIPPKFAFGFGQSRWGYTTKKDFQKVVAAHRNAHVPLDMLYMDIDYMQDYKDFTVNKNSFPDFKSFVQEMKEQNVHLIPIIDAGVKVEGGYEIYEEGKEGGYFCKRADGSDFDVAVWPGWTHFPDVLNPDARAWFGSKYEILISQGIDGFWNDMNEPAIFYTKEGLSELKSFLKSFIEDDKNEIVSSAFHDKVGGLGNNPRDYKRFYHKVNGELVCHEKVHNLFGYNMTRAASEAFEKICPDKRILLFSRSSYIGMHRYGGIWTGDNESMWSHILLNLHMMPSLNMCGFLYTGADIGGFGADASRDLVLRWLAFGIFTPLMRNHSALGTREQEFYQFENIEDFRHVIGVRYRMIPYLYSEYMKAAIGNDMYFKPLSFTYPDDKFTLQIEDQLMIGNEIMVAPVYTQNATGRYVYLPEEMMFIKFLPDGTISNEIMEKGHHYVDIALNEVPLFIRKDKCIPIVDVAECVNKLNMNTLQYIGYKNTTYALYDDDGITPISK